MRAARPAAIDDVHAAAAGPPPAYKRGAGGDALFGPGFLSALIAACRAALRADGRGLGPARVLRRPARRDRRRPARGRPGDEPGGDALRLEKCPAAALRDASRPQRNRSRPRGRRPGAGGPLLLRPGTAGRSEWGPWEVGAGGR